MNTFIDDEDLIHTKTVFRRHSKGPVMFNGCSPSGDVIIIDNISPKKSYDLTGWYIERQTDSQLYLRYTFTDRFIIPPMTTIELWSSMAMPPIVSNDIDHNQSPESDDQLQTYIVVKTKLLTWNSAQQWSVNRLFDCYGHEKAIFSHRLLKSNEYEIEDQIIKNK